MQRADPRAEPQFSQPIRQIMTMLVIIGLVGTGTSLAYQTIFTFVTSNLYLNGFIVTVFLIGVIACFWQVFSLITAVNWIESFAISRPGHESTAPPRLLVSLATLLRSRRKGTQISASSAQSILDSMATRLDETREITRYIINLLIFLGLLGTFYGLATTVPAVVETIRSLAPVPGESSADVFGRLMTGLEKQLGGMGTAFSSSLLGLASSLVVGLLDLFAGHGQSRFYRELEEWLSTITSVDFAAAGTSGTPGGAVVADSDVLAAAFKHMSEGIEALHKTLIRTEDAQTETGARLAELGQTLERLNENLADQRPGEAARQAINEQNDLLMRIIDGQERMARGLLQGQERMTEGQERMTEETARRLDSLTAAEQAREAALAEIAESQQKLAQAITLLAEEGGDPESRMRLRSIDIQLVRILEEMSAGQQDTVAQLRADIAALNKAIRSLGRRAPTQPGNRG